VLTPTRSFECPGKYYEIIRRSFRNLEAETAFFVSYLPSAGEVLDLGCGTGTNLRALNELGHKCMGIDQSQCFLEYAKSAGGDIEYRYCRAVDLETDRHFDLIYSIFVTLNYMKREELKPLFDKVRRWLRPNGRFVLDIGHMLNFVDNYQPYIIAHHESEEILITRLIRHFVNAHTANWRHEETILVRETSGEVLMYKNFFDQMILTAPEVRHLLKDSGLDVVEEFGSFQKTKPSTLGRGHLILVAAPG
jgi:SAM-dependent methyltransferase